jgi:hypothetical protein
MRIGTALFAVALLLLLAGSLLFAYSGLGDMPLAGWIALVAGVFLIDHWNRFDGLAVL